MLKTVDLIIDYGYDILTADVVKSAKLYCSNKEKNILKTLDIKDRLPEEGEVIVDQEKTLNSWSRKEKNLLANFLENNKASESIFVDAYNKKKNFKEKCIVRGSMLKELNTFKNLFNMYPYQNHQDVAREVYKMVINNSLKMDGKKDLEPIKEAFRNFTDADTLNLLISDIKNDNLDTPTVLMMKQSKLLRDKNNQDSKVLKGSSLLFAGIATAVTTTATALTLTGIGTGLLASYAIVKKIFEKVIKAEDKRQIKYTGIELLSQESVAKDLVSSEILNNVLFAKSYDKEKDRQSILLAAFLNEKLSEVKKIGDEAAPLNDEKEKFIRIPGELKTILQDNPKSLDRLENLSFEEIQKLATIKDIKLRDLATLNNIEPNSLNMLRVIDKHLWLKNDSSKSSIDINEHIKNAIDMGEPTDYINKLNDIKTFLDSANNVDKALVSAYLSINSSKIDDKSKFNESAIKELLTDGKINFDSVHKVMNHGYNNEFASFQKEKEKNVVKEVAATFVQFIKAPQYTINEFKEVIKKMEVPKFNREIEKELKDISLKNYYTEVPNRLERMSSFVNNTLPHAATKIYNNVSATLEKMRNNTSNVNGISPT
jgi:hypothetical protein